MAAHLESANEFPTVIDLMSPSRWPSSVDVVILKEEEEEEEKEGF